MAAFVKKYPVTAWLIVARAVSLAVTALVIADLVPDWGLNILLGTKGTSTETPRAVARQDTLP